MRTVQWRNARILIGSATVVSAVPKVEPYFYPAAPDFTIVFEAHEARLTSALPSGALVQTLLEVERLEFFALGGVFVAIGSSRWVTVAPLSDPDSKHRFLAFPIPSDRSGQIITAIWNGRARLHRLLAVRCNPGPASTAWR